MVNEYSTFTSSRLKIMAYGESIGFGKLPNPFTPRPEKLKFTESQVEQFDDYDDVVCIGVGGSFLGLKIIHEFLSKTPRKRNLHFVRNVEELTSLKVDPNPLYVVTSKSGTTAEIVECLDYIGECEVVYQGADMGNPSLVFPIDDHVGGRFSVWDTLFPIALVYGFAVAENIFNTTIQASTNGNLKNTAAWMATRDYSNAVNGYVGLCSMVYSLPLTLTADYLQQLFMESLGKPEATVAPPVVIGGYGPSLQHSVMQYVVGSEAKTACEFVVSQSSITEPSPPSLLVNAQAQVQVMWDLGRNPVVISVENSIDGLVELLTLYELRTVALAEMIGVNPFDQPGVEAGKKYARELTKVVDSGGIIPIMSIV